MSTPIRYHQPVLVTEVLEAAQGARRVVDATLGDGGHAAAFRATGADILGIDRDPDAIATARARLGSEGIRFLQSPYGAATALAAARAFHPDCVLLDLGVSSRQLDDETRGFTFRMGAPIDMRMGSESRSAADLLNGAEEEELRSIFSDYGDERRAAALAREILRRRARARFATSDDFVNAIRAVLGPRSAPSDFARLFQALRIAVNDELSELERALPELRDAVVTGGVLAVISYHSGEDRIVKHRFREWAQACTCPIEQPVCTCRGRPLGRADPRNPILPSAAEIEANPRARSAKLRIFRVGDAA